jgi:hypothetical protein
MSEPPDNIDELLSGGRLGRPARERVLGRVLAAVEAPARAARRRRILAVTLGTGSLAAIAAAVLLFVGRTTTTPAGTYWAAKGAARPAAGSIDPVCESGTASCRIGERLFFRVDGATSPRWLAVFAERADETPPHRIWMFPGPDGVAPEIRPTAEAAVLPRAVELGADLRPGLYRLTVLVFDHPPTRDEAASGASADLRLLRALEIH